MRFGRISVLDVIDHCYEALNVMHVRVMHYVYRYFMWWSSVTVHAM